MQLMVLIFVLFTVISIAGFIGALFFGTTGAVALMVIGSARLLYRNRLLYRALKISNC